jgi:hypothetical protein
MAQTNDLVTPRFPTPTEEDLSTAANLLRVDLAAVKASNFASFNVPTPERRTHVATLAALEAAFDAKKDPENKQTRCAIGHCDAISVSETKGDRKLLYLKTPQEMIIEAEVLSIKPAWTGDEKEQ